MIRHHEISEFSVLMEKILTYRDPKQALEIRFLQSIRPGNGQQPTQPGGVAGSHIQGHPRCALLVLNVKRCTHARTHTQSHTQVYHGIYKYDIRKSTNIYKHIPPYTMLTSPGLGVLNYGWFMNGRWTLHMYSVYTKTYHIPISPSAPILTHGQAENGGQGT